MTCMVTGLMLISIFNGIKVVQLSCIVKPWTTLNKFIYNIFLLFCLFGIDKIRMFEKQKQRSDAAGLRNIVSISNDVKYTIIIAFFGDQNRKRIYNANRMLMHIELLRKKILLFVQDLIRV